MEAVIDQALGKIHVPRAFFRLNLVAENHLVHARTGVRQIVGAFESLANVVCIEYGVFGGLAQAIGSIGQNVGQRANEHPEISVERANAADGLWTFVVEAESAVRLRDQHRLRQEWL